MERFQGRKDLTGSLYVQDGNQSSCLFLRRQTCQKHIRISFVVENDKGTCRINLIYIFLKTFSFIRKEMNVIHVTNECLFYKSKTLNLRFLFL